LGVQWVLFERNAMLSTEFGDNWVESLFFLAINQVNFNGFY
jgi:hypothetical protein